MNIRSFLFSTSLLLATNQAYGATCGEIEGQGASLKQAESVVLELLNGNESGMLDCVAGGGLSSLAVKTAVSTLQSLQGINITDGFAEFAVTTINNPQADASLRRDLLVLATLLGAKADNPVPQFKALIENRSGTFRTDATFSGLVDWLDYRLDNGSVGFLASENPFAFFSQERRLGDGLPAQEKQYYYSAVLLALTSDLNTITSAQAKNLFNLNLELSLKALDQNIDPKVYGASYSELLHAVSKLLLIHEKFATAYTPSNKEYWAGVRQIFEKFWQVYSVAGDANPIPADLASTLTDLGIPADNAKALVEGIVFEDSAEILSEFLRGERRRWRRDPESIEVFKIWKNLVVSSEAKNPKSILPVLMASKYQSNPVDAIRTIYPGIEETYIVPPESFDFYGPNLKAFYDSLARTNSLGCSEEADVVTERSQIDARRKDMLTNECFGYRAITENLMPVLVHYMANAPETLAEQNGFFISDYESLRSVIKYAKSSEDHLERSKTNFERRSMLPVPRNNNDEELLYYSLGDADKPSAIDSMACSVALAHKPYIRDGLGHFFNGSQERFGQTEESAAFVKDITFATILTNTYFFETIYKGGESVFADDASYSQVLSDIRRSKGSLNLDSCGEKNISVIELAYLKFFDENPDFYPDNELRIRSYDSLRRDFREENDDLFRDDMHNTYHLRAIRDELKDENLGGDDYIDRLWGNKLQLSVSDLIK
ncbi:MAG: hypothetical protein HRU19_12605 [Pseudobacteriovorax sp.]|nr:hypothetical protein [Pseudobacteriovorax sp.]